MKHYEATICVGFCARVIAIEADDLASASEKARAYAGRFYNAHMSDVREVTHPTERK
jgi:hypothetical protein